MWFNPIDFQFILKINFEFTCVVFLFAMPMFCWLIVGFCGCRRCILSCLNADAVVPLANSIKFIVNEWICDNVWHWNLMFTIYIWLIVSRTSISLLNICAIMCWMPSLILSTLSRPATDAFKNSLRFGRLTSPARIFNVTSSSPSALARSANVALLSVLYGAYWTVEKTEGEWNLLVFDWRTYQMVKFIQTFCANNFTPNLLRQHIFRCQIFENCLGSRLNIFNVIVRDFNVAQAETTKSHTFIAQFNR